VRAVTVVLLGAELSGCASAPARALDAAAEARGLVVGELSVPGYTLRTFTNAALQSASKTPGTAHRRLHVYLDGDGRPFVTPRRVARDPTPSAPMVLDLLRLDGAPALYLGRPCYHGLQAACDPRDWTVARYGERVVRALAAGILASARAVDARSVVLVGYSGGGALAVLVAARLESENHDQPARKGSPETPARNPSGMPVLSGVVTLAANLDTDAWAAHHRYSPLVGSLNPAHLPVLPVVAQWHLSGAADTNVPPQLQASFRARAAATGTRFQTLPGFTHTCCWIEAWPSMLEVARTAFPEEVIEDPAEELVEEPAE
jgi:hypothetical protein